MGSNENQAVVYQVYLRSFRDADGDGVGDLPGLCEGLPAIADLGCDAIWLNPCYPSPQKDHGYDIADYRSIDPRFGTLDDFDALVDQAHRLGLKVFMDMVANHCSSQHPWFRQALAAPADSPVRRRFLFRDGRGDQGQEPPNNWESVFGGPAWTRTTDADGRPGQWYLHSFDSAQPDFNWRDPAVAAEFESVLAFWFDRGVDGFRIDVAHGNVKDQELPDCAPGHNYAMWDQPEVHQIYRSWRSVADSYQPPRYLVGEIWLPESSSLSAYLRDDELDQAFDFGLLIQPWNGPRMRQAVEAGLAQAGGTLPAWVLSNHDVHRAATRYGQEQCLDRPEPTDMIAAARRQGPVDLALGTRRARAVAALVLALPGAVFLYQGEELGLPEVLDLPDEARQDPIWLRSQGRELGRDGCRVPLPWTAGQASNDGFSPTGAAPAWLPQPAIFAGLNRQAQDSDPWSTLSVYRSLIKARRAMFGDDPGIAWLESPPATLALRRGDGVCVVNFGEQTVALPDSWRPDALVSTCPMDWPLLPPDSACWLKAGEGRH